MIGSFLDMVRISLTGVPCRVKRGDRVIVVSDYVVRAEKNIQLVNFSFPVFAGILGVHVIQDDVKVIIPIV